MKFMLLSDVILWWFVAAAIELVVSSESACLKGDFYCKFSETCISSRLRCNGVTDCEYGEDEYRCNCPVRCDDNTKCLMRRDKCNGIRDCEDGADEADCTSLNCPHGKFSCQKLPSSTLQCVDSSLKCNGAVDCVNGTDEGDSVCKPAASAQSTEQQQQQSCTRDDICDGVKKCADDEPSFCPRRFDYSSDTTYASSCPISVRLATNYQLFYKPNFPIRKCDTIPDCPLGDDEQDCSSSSSLVNTCHADNGLFLCANMKECVSSNAVCDGFSQCSDGSDEFVVNCLRKFNITDGENDEPTAIEPYPDEKCPFRCRLPKLRPESKFSEDEEDTQLEEELMVPFSKFCISLDQVCNNVNDCPYGDDEDRAPRGCPAVDEIRIAVQKCAIESDFDSQDGASLLNCDPVSTRCAVLPASGPTCLCRPGFRPVPDSVTHCTDIDECATGQCQHYCENVVGSYMCACRNGFHLPPGSSTGCNLCEAMTPDDEPYFLFSTSTAIYRLDKASRIVRINLYTADSLQSRPPWSGAIPFDYGRFDDLLVFYNWGAIQAKARKTDLKKVLAVDHDISWISYDDINNNVYFNENGGDAVGYRWKVFYVGIYRKTDGSVEVSLSSKVKTVVHNRAAGVFATNLVLYPEMGLMFFSTFSTKGGFDRLVSCALNGERVTYHGEFKQLRSLSIDRGAGYLYIFDAGRPGLAQINIEIDSPPAKIGRLMWIEERRSFFGPFSFLTFSSGELDSDFYFLSEQLVDGVVKVSFQNSNKSSTMAFNGGVGQPHELISPSSMLANTSFFRVRSTPYAHNIPLDVCYQERQHVCDVDQICLSKPSWDISTSYFVSAVCQCPDSLLACEEKEIPYRSNSNPPSNPDRNFDEFRERSDCSDSNLVTRRKPRKQPRLLESSKDHNVFQIWSSDFYNTSSVSNDRFEASQASYEALSANSQSVVNSCFSLLLGLVCTQSWW